MPITRLFWSAYLAYHLRGQARYRFGALAAIKRDQRRRVRAMVAYAQSHGHAIPPAQGGGPQPRYARRLGPTAD